MIPGSLFCKIILLRLLLLLNINAVNVALNKTGTYCGETPLSDRLFDGDKLVVQHMEEKCSDRSYIEVDLIERYDINYVIVYGGKGNDLGQLDFFLVYRVDNVTKRLCSQYSRYESDLTDDNGKRVNCALSRQLYSKVRIESFKNEGLHVAEIEVHTFGLGIPDERYLLHIGCYGTAPVIGDMEWSECQRSCFTRGYVIVAVKANKFCGCVFNLSRHVESKLENCNFKCNNSYKVCGGKNSFSFYMMRVPLPIYRGCSKTVIKYSNKGIVARDTNLVKCLNNCSNSYHILFEKLTSDKNKKLCLCGVNVDAFCIENSTDCNIKCTGDPQELCGADYASVYTGCFDNSEFYNYGMCSQLFRCAGIHDIYGTCRDGCKPGFYGDHCIEQDIDECLLKPCDDFTSICINLNGSYDCDCKLGFTKLPNGLCQGGVTVEIYRTIHDYFVVMGLITVVVVSVAVVHCYNIKPRNVLNRVAKKRRAIRKYIQKKYLKI